MVVFLFPLIYSLFAVVTIFISEASWPPKNIMAVLAVAAAAMQFVPGLSVPTLAWSRAHDRSW